MPGTPVEPKYVDDLPRSGRLKVSTYITAAILTVLTRNSTTRGYSCRRIAQEVSSHLPGRQFVSASTVYRTLIAEGYGSYKRTVKPGLNDDNKKKRLAWCLEHSLENGWDLEKWKTVIWTDETSVQLGSVAKLECCFDALVSCKLVGTKHSIYKLRLVGVCDP